MKKQFLFLFYLLAGILVGSLLAGAFAKIPGLSWLAYTNSIGFSKNSPAVLDFIIIRFTFGFEMAISIAQVITISIAMFLFSKARIK